MNTNQDHIHAAWQKYIVNKEPIPEQVDGIRPDILRSWKRSQGLSDPFEIHPSFILKEEFRHILQENTTLMNIAFPYIQKFYEIFRGLNCHILLTDAKGIQLLSFSENSESNPLSPDIPLENGSLYSEKIMGTNCISLCLTENRPVRLTGPEHYRKQYHGLVCHAAPIHNSSAVCVGCLCISSSIDRTPGNTIDLLTIAVSGIENELCLSQYNGLLNSVIDLYEPAILILDCHHKIRRHNLSCEKILKLTKKELEHRSLDEVISTDALSGFLKNLTVEFQMIECTLYNLHNEPLYLTVSAKRFADPHLPDDAILLMFSSQEAIHKQTSRIAGFRARFTFESVIQRSVKMQRVVELGKLAADSMSHVLITGESGTGKELLAHAIHNASPRSQGPFVTINCASLQKELLEGELFGFEGSPFSTTGTQGNPGKFELARGGTLYLNEISSMPMDAQATLLRVLQNREITRIGGKTSKPIDVRIIASTHMNLMTAIQNKTFRDDLYYRLNVLNINIPPLRDRIDDIIPLFEYYVRNYRRNHGSRESLRITKDAIQALKFYPWPGNVRELESVTERVLYLISGSTLHLSDLPTEIVNPYLSNRYQKSGNPVSSPAPGQRQTTLSDVQTRSDILPPDVQEYNVLLEAIQKAHGNVKTASTILALPVSTLYRKLRKYGINAKDYLYWK